MIIVGCVVLGQLLPAGLREYLPGTAVQAAITVHHSSGLLMPNAAIAVLGAYAAVAASAVLLIELLRLIERLAHDVRPASSRRCGHHPDGATWCHWPRGR
jgi:hypothetical protein